MKIRTKEQFDVEIASFKKALGELNDQKCIFHLGRAHIISQSSTMTHLYVHLLMLNFALKKLNGKEVAGQILRLLVTIPGHLIGKVPQGNIGWSTVGLTEQMPIPDDLKDLKP